MNSFFRELKQRRVVRVAVGYAIAAWLIIQIGSTVLPTFHVPEWVLQALIVVVALGFPAALVLAWAFDVTPSGIEKATESNPADAVKNRRNGWLLAGAGLLVAVAAIGGYWLWHSSKRTAAMPSGLSMQRATANFEPAKTIPDKSIAVLPFDNLSRDPDNAYFAEGIQDEILTRLAKIADLKVISHTSTQRFKSAPGDLRQIAQQLGVANLLEGSVQKAGESVRVNVQLIKAEGDSHLWAETYDRKLTDIFAVESEVAQRIATSLEAKLSGHEKEAINYIGTKIPAAYDAYLRGIALRNSQSREGQEQLIKFCRQAVTLDPDYAAAWADIAVAEGLRYIQGNRTEAQRALVQEAAENALRLDPDHGSGHAAMGMYLYYCLQEYDQALIELQKSREQEPNSPLTLQAVGLVKRRQGKLDESVALQLQAAQTDPLNQDIWVNLGWSYRGMRKFVEAQAMFDRALAIAPNELSILARKAETYLAAGNLEGARRLVEAMDPKAAPEVFIGRIMILVFERKFDEAIAKITADLANGTDPPFDVVWAHLTLGALHFKTGHGDQAAQLLSQAEAELNALRKQDNVDRDVLPRLLEVHALQSRREDVDREAAELIARQGKDRWSGPDAEADVARAYAVMGDREHALPILERLFGEPSADALTPAYLRMDPFWDAIRDDPRFQKLANPQ